MVFQDAFLELLSETPVGRISVSDICARTDMNRSTFYAHYKEPEDIMAEIEQEMIDNLPLDIRAADASFIRSLELFLNYADQHRNAFSLLLQRDPQFKETLLNAAITPVLTNEEKPAHSDPPVHSLRLNYIAAGSLYVVEKWLRGDFVSTPREVVSYLMEFSEN